MEEGATDTARVLLRCAVEHAIQIIERSLLLSEVRRNTVVVIKG